MVAYNFTIPAKYEKGWVNTLLFGLIFMKIN